MISDMQKLLNFTKFNNGITRYVNKMVGIYTEKITKKLHVTHSIIITYSSFFDRISVNLAAKCAYFGF